MIPVLSVRIEGHEPRPYEARELVVEDDKPWIDIKYAASVRKSVLERACPPGGSIEVFNEPELGGEYFRWTFFADKSVHLRRRGRLELGGKQSGLAPVAVIVSMGRIFSPAQYGRMLESIRQLLRDAVWDRVPGPGVWISRENTDRASLENALLAEVRDELAAAAAIRRNPLSELAPVPPGSLGLPWAPHLCLEERLPENEVVDSWANIRAAELLRTIDAAKARLERTRTVLNTRAGSADDPRVAFLMRQISEMETSQAVLADALVAVRRFATRRNSTPTAITPAMTRDPRRRRLLAAFRPRGEIPQLSVALMLSTMLERTTPEIFELWGAIAIVSALELLGWRMLSRPVAFGGDESLPDRLVWSLGCDAETIELIFEPHAFRPAIAEVSDGGARRSLLQRAVEGRADDAPHGLVCSGPNPSPDYALLYRGRSGRAFCVGDAQCSDLAFLARPGTAERLWPKDKIKKVAEDYGRHLAWWTPGELTACSAVASFVLLPGDETRWLNGTPLEEEVRKHDVIVLGALPREPVEGSPVSLELLGQIVETLRCHAVDRSNRIPLRPGLE